MTRSRRIGNRHRTGRVLLAAACWGLVACAAATTATGDAAPPESIPAPAAGVGLELFEKKIRPLLLERCVACHGGESIEASLRLTSREAMTTGGDSGPAVIAGRPAESLLVQVVEYLGDIQMPPDGKLAESDITALKNWVAAGAPMPAAPIVAVADPGPQRAFEPTAEHRRWWAFQPLTRPAVPPPASGATGPAAAWPRDDIDRFVLAALEARGLAPAAEADRRTWLRRVTFDLTGLPPTEDEQTSFLADESPRAHERVVDRLLASPAYGERQARHWLDVARYADAYQAGPQTHGSSSDFELLEAWRYRNWVVSAFNRDLPFDRFITRQIAGDLVREPLDGGDDDPAAIDTAGLTATTFLTLGSWDHGDADKEKLVGDIVDDQIDTVGKAFLGLTLGCARCHDHKFDPVSTADYYALAGIFHSTRTLGALGGKGGHSILGRVPLVPAAAVKAHDEAKAALAAVVKKLAELDKRTPPPAADDAERVALVAERERLEAAVPPAPPRAMAVQEGGVPGGLFPKIQDVPIHVRGSYTRLGAVVPRRMPAFFAGEQQPSIAEGSGRRELAAWVASETNPLTPRVIVNRVWQWHFGRGLVTTPSNFGMLAEKPSHPELLDWLAATFIDEGWSLKKLHRRIVLSATYRQSSRAEPAAVEADPENRWVGRFSPRRLDAEEIRDAMLVVARRLPAPAGEAGVGGPATHDLADPRRSLYVQTTRWERGNYSTLFDAANPDASVEARSVSPVAPQALFLLNSDFVAGIARDIAARVAQDVPGTPADAERGRIIRAWRLVLGRGPAPDEITVARGLLAAQGPDGKPPADGTARLADLAQVLVCGNEFFHVE
ncbi:MAG: PSD1 and planctomycete cytochrome C domain-containing protein [Planctomycetaceae bacterium]